MSRSCVNSADLFFYVFGEMTLGSQRRSERPLIKKHFGCKQYDQDKKLAPHIVYESCALRLGGWMNRNGMVMPFAVPMLWREPQTTAVTAPLPDIFCGKWYEQKEGEN